MSDAKPIELNIGTWVQQRRPLSKKDVRVLPQTLRRGYFVCISAVIFGHRKEWEAYGIPGATIREPTAGQNIGTSQ